MPGTMSVADFERRRDAATTHCLRELEQQLKDHKKRQILRKFKWSLASCGILAFLVLVSFLCPVFPKVCNVLCICKSVSLPAWCTTLSVLL